MSKTEIPLEAILASICKYKKTTFPSMFAKKRTILNKAAVGGISSRTLAFFFFTLPFIEFFLIFNPVVFAKLGIAQSIVFYIVFMSIIMMIIFGLSWKNNKSVIAKITPSWNSYFPDIDLKQILSSGITPYSDFFSRYSIIAGENPSSEALQSSLRKAFDEMKEENKDLLEAMERDSSR